MTYILEHTRLGFCWWDIPALILLVGLVVYLIWNHRKQEKLIRELEDQLAEPKLDL